MAYKGKVLLDHLKKGSTLYPQFTYRDGKSTFTDVNWRADILPELLWIGMLIHTFDYHRAMELAKSLAFLADQSNLYGNKKNFGLVSGYLGLSKTDTTKLTKKLSENSILEDLKIGLKAFHLLYDQSPFKFLYEPEELRSANEEELKTIAIVLDHCLERRNLLPTLVQGIYYEVILHYGKLNLSRKVKSPNTACLLDYPTTEESESAAAYIRCCVTSIPMEKEMFEEAVELNWPLYFWSVSKEIGSCDPMKSEGVYPDQLPDEFISYSMELFSKYSESSNDIWNQIMASYSFNVYAPEKDHVLLGLASRMYRLCIQITSFIPNWTADIGQIYLRLIVESYIYYSWLSKKGTAEDFSKFIEHGEGRRKLTYEHTVSYMKQNGLSEEEAIKQAEVSGYFLTHKFKEFIPVNLGNPLGKDLRTLADQADIKEFYALVYSPASSAVHGMYDNLEDFYMQPCQNPFHCRHYVPYYWYKSGFSLFGVNNSLSIVDWVLSDLIKTTDVKKPDIMPGEQYIEDLWNTDLLEEYSQRPEVKADIEVTRKRLERYSKTRKESDVSND